MWNLKPYKLTFCTLKCRTSLVPRLLKILPAMKETRVQSVGWEDSLEKETATHSSILAWRIPWTIHGIAKSWTWLSDFHFTLKCNGLSRTLSWSFTHDFCNITHWLFGKYILWIFQCWHTSAYNKSLLTSPLILLQKSSSVGSYLAHGGRYKFPKIWKLQFYHWQCMLSVVFLNVSDSLYFWENVCQISKSE